VVARGDAMKTILVVDDEWVIVSVLELVLTDAGYRVVTAPNGRIGLERLAETRPDVILLDFMMPVMNGAAMFQALQAHRDYKDIPVILMTSLPERVVRNEVDGYKLYLSKPFLDRELLSAIDQALTDRDT
jgi:CheY-like chemotaxis protein